MTHDDYSLRMLTAQIIQSTSFKGMEKVNNVKVDDIFSISRNECSNLIKIYKKEDIPISNKTEYFRKRINNVLTNKNSNSRKKELFDDYIKVNHTTGCTYENNCLRKMQKDLIDLGLSKSFILSSINNLDQDFFNPIHSKKLSTYDLAKHIVNNRDDYEVIVNACNDRINIMEFASAITVLDKLEKVEENNTKLKFKHKDTTLEDIEYRMKTSHKFKKSDIVAIKTNKKI